MGTLAIWMLSGFLGVQVWRKHGGARLRAALVSAAKRSLALLPRIVLAVLTAGFVSRLIPMGFVTSHMGPQSGFGGMVIAMLVGAVIPAGPIIAFPLVVVLANAGAGVPQLITFLTAWSVFALHRILTYEIPLMGARFTATRFLASLPLPLIAGGLTALVLSVLP